MSFSVVLHISKSDTKTRTPHILTDYFVRFQIKTTRKRSKQYSSTLTEIRNQKKKKMKQQIENAIFSFCCFEYLLKNRVSVCAHDEQNNRKEEKESKFVQERENG